MPDEDHAHSREDVDRLLAEIVRLKAELAQYAGIWLRPEVEKRGTGGYCVHRDAQGRLGCMAPQQRDSIYCYQHDPARAADRQAAADKARETRRRHTAEREENVRRWQERTEGNPDDRTALPASQSRVTGGSRADEGGPLVPPVPVGRERRRGCLP